MDELERFGMIKLDRKTREAKVPDAQIRGVVVAALSIYEANAAIKHGAERMLHE
jgi:hypothetical protein